MPRRTGKRGGKRRDFPEKAPFSSQTAPGSLSVPGNDIFGYSLSINHNI